MKIALYHSNKDNVPKTAEVSWGQLVEILGQHTFTQCAPCVGHSCPQKYGRAWSPVEIDGSRSNKNVRAVTAFVLDFDGLTQEQTVSSLSRFQGYAHAVYTTHSHSAMQPSRYALRLVARLSRPVLASEWVGFRARALKFFGVEEEQDPSCKEPARLYFLPTAPQGGAHFAGAEEGADLNVDQILAMPGPAPVMVSPLPVVPAFAPIPAGAVDLEEIRRRLKLVRNESSKELAKDILEGRPLGYSEAQRSAGMNNRPRHVGMLRCASVVAFAAPAGTPLAAVLEILRPGFNAMDFAPQGRDHCWGVLVDLATQAVADRAEHDAREAEDHRALIATAFGPEAASQFTPVSAQPAVGAVNASTAATTAPAQAGPALSSPGGTGDLLDDLESIQHPPFAAGPHAGAAADRTPDWALNLIWKKDKDGNPSVLKNCSANASATLRMDVQWKGMIRRNTFTGQTELFGGPVLNGRPGPVPITDELVTAISLWLQQRPEEKLRVELSTSTLYEVINAVAVANEYNPLMDYVNGLEWDGVPRLDTWLERYMGAKVQDASGEDVTKYVRTVASKWLIAAIARVFEPGCKVQNVLILEGAQDLKKSSALEVLASREFFTDSALDIGAKDTSIMTTRTWIVELAELDAFRKSEHTQAKAFFTRDWEEYRPPYGRTMVKRPRICIFAGTSNKEDYLTDPTGNRRYWPVTCTKVDLQGLREVRDQIWAEAKVRYQAGRAAKTDCLWWLDDVEKELAKSAAEERLASDDWEDPILRWWSQMAGRTNDVRMSSVLEVALNIPRERASPAAQSRAGAVLKRLGFARKRKRDGGRLVWYYEPSQALAQSQPAVPVGGQGHLSLLEGGA